MATVIDLIEYKNQKWIRDIFSSLQMPQKAPKTVKTDRTVEYDDSVANILKGAEPENKANEVSKKPAIKIFLDYLSGDVHIYGITDVVPYRDRLWDFPDGIDCWCAIYRHGLSPFGSIKSSSLVAISKDTGEIIYQGSCNDEG